MFNRIYALPLPLTFFLAAASAVVWYILRIYFGNRKFFTGSSIVLACMWLYLVLYFTLLNRTPGKTTVVPEPFAQIRAWLDGSQPEMLRSFWMNLTMFVPGGLFVPDALPRTWCRRASSSAALVICFAVSLGIELAQWHWHLGEAETDDVIANTLGALLSLVLLKAADVCRNHCRKLLQ